MEICRKRANAPLPSDLESAYFAALEKLPQLAAAAAVRPWDADMLRCVLGAIAAAKGDATVAEAALEMSPEGAAAYMQWVLDQ